MLYKIYLYRVFDYIPSLASQAVQSVLLKQAGVGGYRSKQDLLSDSNASGDASGAGGNL